MGVKLATLAVAGLVASTPAGYLQGRQAANGGFVEPTGSSGPQLTAWAALGLKASGASTGRALDYLSAHEGELTETTDVELVALAEDLAAAGSRTGSSPESARAAVERRDRADRQLDDVGDPGAPAGRAAGPSRCGALRAPQAGPLGRLVVGTPEAAQTPNDTAAAIRRCVRPGWAASGPAGARVSAATPRNRDGGFELTPVAAPTPSRRRGLSRLSRRPVAPRRAARSRTCAACGERTAASAIRAATHDARLGHRPGPTRACRQGLPSALAHA